MNLKEHWNHVYQTKEHDDVSFEACGVGKQGCIIDVGSGASVLVDFLLDAGFTRLAVLAAANRTEAVREAMRWEIVRLD